MKAAPPFLVLGGGAAAPGKVETTEDFYMTGF